MTVKIKEKKTHNGYTDAETHSGHNILHPLVHIAAFIKLILPVCHNSPLFSCDIPLEGIITMMIIYCNWDTA